MLRRIMIRPVRPKNTTYTPYRCFLDRPGLFDAKLFDIPPREAAQMDPAQRLLLLTTYESFELAGYTQNRSPPIATDRIGPGCRLRQRTNGNTTNDLTSYDDQGIFIQSFCDWVRVLC